MGEGSRIPTDPHQTPTFIQPSTQPQKTQQPRKPKRKDTQVPQSSDPIKIIADETVIRSGGPRCQETMGDTIAQTRFKNVSKHSNDSLLARGNTLKSDEDRLKLDELMVSKHSNDSLLTRDNTLQSDEERLKLDELMALCTTL
ncbi:hypothetical protein Tco_0439533 [Tanacetum coccineum]